MGKYDHRSRDQKRKAKLKKEAEKSRKHEPLAYHGKKYKTEEYVSLMLQTETAIYEAYVVSGRTLDDNDVEAELERLVLLMRKGPILSLESSDDDRQEGDAPPSLIHFLIRRRWQEMAERQALPKREDVIGVVRTILGSLETWRSQSMHSRGYLHFLEGFLKQAGVNVRQVGPDELIAPVEEDVDPLLELGRDWIEGDEAAMVRFTSEIQELLREGDADRVVEVCQQLLGETRNMAVVPHLEALALSGHRAIQAQGAIANRPDPRAGRLPGPG